MRELRYPEVERVLARMYDVGPRVLKEFSARLRHLRNIDIPVGIKKGKGRRPAYSEEQIFQMVLALELAEAEVTAGAAERFVQLRSEGWFEFYKETWTGRKPQRFFLITPRWMLDPPEH